MPTVKVVNSPNFDWLHWSTNQVDSNYCLLLVKYTISRRRCLSIVLIVSLSYFAGSVESLVGVYKVLCRQFSGPCRLSLLPLGRPRLSVTEPLFDSVSLPIFCCFVFCLQWTCSTISLGLTTWVFSSFVTRHVPQIDKLVERSDCRTSRQSKHRGITRFIPIHSLRGYWVYKPIIYFRYNEFVSEIKPYI